MKLKTIEASKVISYIEGKKDLTFYIKKLDEIINEQPNNLNLVSDAREVLHYIKQRYPEEFV